MAFRPISGKSYLLPLLLLCASLCAAQTAVPVVLAPVPQLQFFTQAGQPNSFGCVFTYQSQTTTPLATFSDFTGQFQNQNPVLLNAGGSANIWLQSGQAYTLTVKSSGGDRCALGQTLYTVDGVGGGASQLNTVVTPSGGSAAFTVQSQNQLFSITLTGNVAGSPVSFIGVIAPALVTFQITEDGAGAHTFTWPSNVIGASAIDTVANRTTSQTFLWNGTTIMPVGSGFSSTGDGLFQGIATLKNLNNVLFIDPKTSDIGAAINAAYASLPANGGMIVVVPKADNSCYSFTTPIVANVSGKYLLLQGEMSGGTGSGCLNFTPTTGSAITFDYVPVGGSRGAVYGVKDLFLSNNLCTSIGGCGGSTTGISVGSTNGGIDGAIMQNVTIQGFTVGYGENARVPSSEVQWSNPRIYNNGVGMNLFATAEEQIIGGTFYGNGNHIQAGDVNSSPELHITGTYFIAHSSEAFNFTNTSLEGSMYLTDVHLENGANSTINAHFIEGNVSVFGKGGVAEDDSSSGTSDWWFKPNGNAFIWDAIEVVTASRNPTIGVLNLAANTRAKLGGFVLNPGTLTAIVGGANAAKATVCMLSGNITNAASTCTMEAPLAFTVGKGIGADGSGYKHKRFGATCTTTTTAGNSCTTTFSWTTAFTDANYTPVCTGVGPANGPTFAIDSFNASGVTVRVATIVALASGYSGVDCIGVHD